ncbi:hypothetical protein ONZ43_g7712 [Nemania bipapillata]|uniref:Uncharacterized protein n=1 Tax=Nemania bipapillata TaxID=110536 RepID=A0ACC2HPP0_9PEZI|nr:hypothetical protein ONZ43_g7712 [Nemania bipapillata]
MQRPPCYDEDPDFADGVDNDIDDGVADVGPYTRQDVTTRTRNGSLDVIVGILGAKYATGAVKALGLEDSASDGESNELTRPL